VTTFKVNDTLFESFISIQGNVDTRENILIFPEYQGVLTTLNVKEGQRVSKGKYLQKLMTADFPANWHSLKPNMN
jgi:membrane fusion protein, multidrug efflux system